VDVHDLWDDGRWIGPRSLRVFLRVNRGFALLWYLVLAGICWAVWSDVLGAPWFASLPLGLASSTLPTLAFMFLFSRGWISEGD
jgi:hypothetical protein